MGDAKFSGTLGVALGWMKGLFALEISIAMAVLYAMGPVALYRGRRLRSRPIAFAPFLSLAAGLVLWPPIVLHRLG